MARKPQPMHVEEIKARICMKWGTLAALSAHLGRSSNSVSNAVRQAGYSAAIEAEIAADLDMLPHEIWPDRYHADGTPIAYRSHRLPTPPATARQRRKEVAA